MQKNKQKKVLIIVASLAGVLFLVLGVGYWQRTNLKKLAGHFFPPKTLDTAPVQADGKPQTEAKDRADQAAEASKAKQPTTINPQITSIDQNATSVSVRAIVNTATSGTCTLKLQKSGQADIVQTAPIAQVTSYYACQGFNVPKNQIPAKGQWTVAVLFQNDQGSGQSGDIINVN